MDAQIRAIDPSRCWVRHIVRGESGDDGAQLLGRVYFVRDDALRGRDGVNGHEGWQAADISASLSDDGSFSLTLPNVEGADGVLHRRRFACITDADYEPGEEWLEFWSDFDMSTPLFVGTPTDYEKTKSTVTIKGRDLNAVLDSAYSSEIDIWDATGPADVIAHYSRLPVLIAGAQPNIAVPGDYFIPVSGMENCWTVEADMRLTGTTFPDGTVNLLVGPGIAFSIDDTGEVLLGYDTGTEFVTVAGTATVSPPASLTMRLIARYDRLFGFVNGELVVQLRRKLITSIASVTVRVIPSSGSDLSVTLDRLHVETLSGFAARGDSAVIQRQLPGLPPATGLRARYWSADSIYAPAPSVAMRNAQAFQVGIDPAVDRLEPSIAYTGSGGPDAIGGAFFARWSGAIYLDLETASYKLRLSGLNGLARIYVGRTLRGDEAAQAWWSGSPTITTPPLRDWIGESGAGWYPIVIELSQAANNIGITLQGAPCDDAGTLLEGYATVPQESLSPIGCYEDELRNTPHRTVIGDVAGAFGYQWRVLPRSLQSGEFPGQFEFRSLIGRQTDLIIDDDQVGSEAVVQGACADVVDGIIADAAGIADPSGSGQLSAQVVDYERAVDHLALRQGYESLSEITEQPLLITRIDSLLALRSSPNEQVGVRPLGQRDLVDTFELTGELARMDWTPGDGVRLQLDALDVKDDSPRQMTQVSWSPRPDGLGFPTVAFRQRPRSASATLRRLRAIIYGPRRTYQGGVALTTGAPGGTAGTVDDYSRAPLPADLKRIRKVEAVVQYVTTSAADWRLEVNGIDLGAAGTVTNPGRYDITKAAKRPAVSGQPYVYARLIGGTGTYLMTLEVKVRV